MRFRETVTLLDGAVVVREVEWENEKLLEWSYTRAWMEGRLFDFFGKVPAPTDPSAALLATGDGT